MRGFVSSGTERHCLVGPEFLCRHGYNVPKKLTPINSIWCLYYDEDLDILI